MLLREARAGEHPAGLLGTELCMELPCSRARMAGSKRGEKEHFLVSDLAGKEPALN